MPGFEIINSPREISLSNQWVLSPKFDSRNRIVDEKGEVVSSDYRGHRYKLIEKRERTFSFPERIGRGFLGTLAVVCTIGFAYFLLKSVQNLFKPKETVRFAVLVPPSSNLPSQINPIKPVKTETDQAPPADPVKTETDQAPPIVPVKTETDQTPPADPYPELTKARDEFLTWFSKKDSDLGKGEYDTLIKKVNTLSKDLPKKKITLHCDYFRFGFSLFYVEKPGEKKYMPAKRLDGVILNWQVRQAQPASWPLKDPQDNNYFIPEITLEEVSGTHSGSETTGNYLHGLLSSAASDKKSSSYRNLEGLTGYAEDIQKELGNAAYKKLKETIPSYPDLPDLPAKQFTFF